MQLTSSQPMPVPRTLCCPPAYPARLNRCTKGTLSHCTSRESSSSWAPILSQRLPVPHIPPRRGSNCQRGCEGCSSRAPPSDCLLFQTSPGNNPVPSGGPGSRCCDKNEELQEFYWGVMPVRHRGEGSRSGEAKPSDSGADSIPVQGKDGSERGRGEPQATVRILSSCRRPHGKLQSRVS